MNNMYSPCIIINEKDSHHVKGMLANILHKRGFRQLEISRMLNITQPMVCKYLKQTGYKPEIRQAASIIAESVMKSRKATFSYVITPDSLNGYEEYYISTKESILVSEKSEIVQSITNSLGIIKDKDFSALLPKVKVNIAMALSGASSKKDVASVPSGLIFINGYLKTHSEPEFGYSNHLASILLYAMNISKDISAVVNVKYSKDVMKRIKKQKMSYGFLDDRYRVKKEMKEFDVLLHKGLFGIEPTAYVFGTDAVDAMQKCCKLLK